MPAAAVCKFYSLLPFSVKLQLVAACDSLVEELEVSAGNCKQGRKLVRSCSGVLGDSDYNTCAQSYFLRKAAALQGFGAASLLVGGTQFKCVLDASLSAVEFREHMELLKECGGIPDFCFLRHARGSGTDLSTDELRRIARAAHLLFPGRPNEAGDAIAITDAAVADAVACARANGGHGEKMRARFDRLRQMMIERLIAIQTEAVCSFARYASVAAVSQRSSAASVPVPAPAPAPGVARKLQYERTFGRGSADPVRAGPKSVEEQFLVLLADSSLDACFVRSLSEMLLAYHMELNKLPAATEDWWRRVGRKSVDHYRALCDPTGSALKSAMERQK